MLVIDNSQLYLEVWVPDSILVEDPSSAYITNPAFITTPTIVTSGSKRTKKGGRNEAIATSVSSASLVSSVYLTPSSLPDQKKQKLTIEEKREITEHQLACNFPTCLPIFFGVVYLTIGVTAMGLQIWLIVNMSVNHFIANGLWGGLFAITNGLIKLNMGINRFIKIFIYKVYYFILFFIFVYFK